MTTSANSVPERVARELAQHGVKVAFGVPGGEGSSELIQALQRNGVEFVLCHTESQAAFAAAAMSEVTGTAGVVLTSLGPGAANAVNGAAHALLDRAPLLVITDRFGQEHGPESGHQFIDQTAMYSPVTKRSVRLQRTDPAGIVRQALATAMTQPRGPVHIDFPADLADAEALPAAPGSERGTAGLDVVGEEATDHGQPGDLQPLLEALLAAQRPVVICGLGVMSAAERAAVARLLPLLRAPALTTYKAIGAASQAPAWNAGLFTGGALEEEFLDQADLILTLGFDAVEMIPTKWRWRAPVLRLTASPAPCPVTEPKLQARGQLTNLLQALSEAVTARRGSSTWTQDEVGRLREQSHARVVTSWSPAGINPTVAVQELAAQFPDATFSVDAGAHMFAATLALSYAGAQRCSISNGLSTMGYALPAAVGAAYAEPGRTAVALSGDGGLSMCLAELETAVRSGHRLVVFLLNDDQLSLIKIKQEAKGHTPQGVGYGRTDWPALAAAFGARASRAATPEELTARLDEAAGQTQGVDFIEVVLAPDGYAGLMDTVRGHKRAPEQAAVVQ